MGAGGGGFLMALTRLPHAHAQVAEVLRAGALAPAAAAEIGAGEDEPWSVHRVTVDDVGLVLTTEPATAFLYKS
jgi:hypothetical protein